MNQQLGRLFLAGLCCLTAVSAAPAQPYGPNIGPDGRPIDVQRLRAMGQGPGPNVVVIGPDGRPRVQPPPQVVPLVDDTPLPSHRPLDSSVGDLTQAQDLLSHRLHRTHNLQDLQDLLKPLADNPELLKQFKGMKPEDLKELEEAVKNNPGLLDDPKLGDMLKQVDRIKHGESLPDDKKEELEKWAKDFFDNHKKELSPLVHPENPITGGPTDPKHPLDPAHAPPPHTTPPPPPFPPTPPAAKSSNWLSRDMIDSFTGVVKDLDKSGEGESLRTALRELGRLDSGPSNSTGLAGLASQLPKGWFSSEDASWLAQNLKPPSMPNFGGGNWSAGPSLGAASSGGGESGGVLDAVVWIAALALLGAAMWMAFAMARQQAAKARAKAWQAGPWPVRPSQVSTREDLIRAFEHLAFLCLGLAARSLNHLDLASRLGADDDGRAEAAGRLARLYEHARYAPPDELLPPDELTAARGDLTALAGAAA